MKTFPNYIFISDESLSIRQKENVNRVEMDSGPSKLRTKQSRPMFVMSFEIATHTDNYESFNSWIRENQYGLNWFLINHPLNGKQVKARIVDTSLPWTKKGNILTSNMEVEFYNE